MVQLQRMTKKIMVLLFAGCVSLIASGVAWSESQDSMVVSIGQTSAELIVKGKVRKISFETNTILLKPKKGGRISIIFSEKTELKGFDHFQEIQKKQALKIWYTVEGENNIAIKIEKIPELGC